MFLMKDMKKTQLLTAKPFHLLAFCLLLSLQVQAVTSRLYTSKYLTSGLISCLCQDRQGFIWIGTEYGLNKFDGYHFTYYYHSQTDSTTVTDNDISSLYVDRDGTLWVGSSKGLSRYNRETDNFQRYQFPDGRTPRISTITQTADGRLLLGSSGYGLYSYPPHSTFIHYEDRFNQRRADDFYTHMHIDRQGHFWRSSHTDVLTRYILKNGQPTALRDYVSDCGQPVSYIEYNKQQLLIVCKYGILAYDYQTGEVKGAGFDLSQLDKSINIKKACLTQGGDLYIATSTGGLMVIDKGSRKLTLVDNSSSAIDLAKANVVDLIEDKNQHLWAACYNKGVLQVSKEATVFNTFSLTSQHFITGSAVTSIAPAINGGTWCVVPGSGIFLFDANGQVVAHPQSPEGTEYLFRSRDGHYWLTSGNTLYRYDPYRGIAHQEQTLKGNGTYSIVDDAGGRLYISTDGSGLYVYDPATRQGWQLSMHQTKRKEGYLNNDWIKSMVFDSHGLLWICTTNGVSVMRPEGFVFNSLGWNVLLEGQQCFTACEQKDGSMLIGTEHGLYRYDRRSRQAAPVAGTQPLSTMMPCAMVCDRQGDVWISTTNGIWQYRPQTRRLLSHIAGNGLTVNEYVPGAVIHQPDDRITFGAADGIVTFLPREACSLHRCPGTLHLTRISANGTPLNPLQKEYRLDYTNNSLRLEYSTLDYEDQENISLQYRFSSGSQWVQNSEGSNQLVLNQLQPDSYHLEVRAVAGGRLAGPSTTLLITILPPWYKSLWAYLAYSLIAACFIGLILFNWERQRNRNLEEAKMEFLINATHDIRSPLTLIMAPLEKLKRRFNDPESQEDLRIIDKNAQRLLTLVNQILDKRRIDKQQLKLSYTETDLISFVNGIFKLYEYQAHEEGIKYHYIHPDGILKVWIDRVQFDKVVSNLLSNAFKYTQNEITVSVLANYEQQCVTIEVTDNGNGFEDSHTERYFTRFYQGKNAQNCHIDGTGIGLNLCRILTEMHGGTVTAQNRKDGSTGAILTITLPLGKNHLNPDDIVTPERPSHPMPKAQASRNLHILLVDDDPEIANYIKTELRDWFRFEYAANGREAIKLLLTKPYDLVVSDIMMPEMDGITLLRSIKSNTNISDIPVILLTSKSDVQYRLEGMKKGADAYIAKPFNMEELHVTIDNLVDNVRRLRGKFSGAQQQQDKVENIQVKGNDDILMEKILKSINANLSNSDYDITQLTRDVGISRAQLHRKMKEITGISTTEFIRNLRLEQAARLIREKKLNVTQIAYTVGFENQAHFSTVFKKHFGMTPTEFGEKNES